MFLERNFKNYYFYIIRGKFMLGNILCFIAGGIFGVVIMCCFVAAGDADERNGLK